MSDAQKYKIVWEFVQMYFFKLGYGLGSGMGLMAAKMRESDKPVISPPSKKRGNFT